MSSPLDIQFCTTASNVAADTLFVVFLDGEPSDDEMLRRLPRAESLMQCASAGRLPSTRYSSIFLHAEGGQPGVLLVAAGPRQALEPIILMRLASASARAALASQYDRLAFVDPEIADATQFAHAVVEGAIRGAYDPALKKTKKEVAIQLSSITLVSRADAESLREGADWGRAVGQARSLARDLINLPPNELTPSAFAARAQALSAELPLSCTVLDEQAMQELGMGAILGVAAGSQEPPRVIELRYGTDDAPVTVSLVGKGLTFDSGGLSLKTAEGMETMKHDMGGAGAVVAGMVAIAELKLPNVQVRAYIGATENMPSGSAMRPGDVLTALNGETIEVLNTDAEGRLVLADLLCYAKQQGADHVVDFATLTGGAVVALGSACSLAAGNSADWVGTVVDAAGRGLERAWRMPLFDEYRRAMDSEIADIKNTGGRAASSLTASAFLSDFAQGMEWAHIDIAGTSWADKASAFEAKGATGEGVGTIVSLVRGLSQSG